MKVKLLVLLFIISLFFCGCVKDQVRGFGDPLLKESKSTTLYPASDPENSGNWVLKEDMSDEFEGDIVDSDKWLVQGTDGN